MSYNFSLGGVAGLSAIDAEATESATTGHGGGGNFISQAINSVVDFVSEEVVDPIQQMVGRGWQGIGEAIRSEGGEVVSDLFRGAVGGVAAIGDAFVPGKPFTKAIDQFGTWVGQSMVDMTYDAGSAILGGLGFQTAPMNTPFPAAKSEGAKYAGEFGYQFGKALGAEYGRFGGSILRDEVYRSTWDERVRMTEAGAKLTGPRPSPGSRKAGIRRGTPFYGTRAKKGGSGAVDQPRVVYH
jgi:hypothetical protein